MKPGRKGREINLYTNTYQYDLNGNLTEKTTTLLPHPRHQLQLTTTYSYDSTNLLTKITYPDGRENNFINCT
ncbi:MAG: hypothetical protein DRP73_05115 [Candidatus Omnitrophota bacterium]|nr:MAG: hypothetical protein DRP73_05115 [Candidatus Omnitrophota bacterium]